MLFLLLGLGLIFNILGTASAAAADNEKIIGGSSNTIEQYPYSLALLSDGELICGATLIETSYVVTAGHCVKGASMETLSLKAGSTDYSEGTTLKIKKVNIHPKFNKTSLDYDIAVLQLTKAVQTSATITPIELVEAGSEMAVGKYGILTGWGTSSEDTAKPNSRQVLKSTKVPIVSQEECKNDYPGLITKRMFCAGYHSGGRDACQGDSGGPIALNNKLIGIISWGRGCGEPKYYGVYTRIAIVREFIDSITKGGKSQKSSTSSKARTCKARRK